MKLFMAIADHIALMEGSSREIIGVYDSKEKAIVALKRFMPETGIEVVKDTRYRYIFDGEYQIYYEVEELELNKDLAI